jgi:hypothetical protein
MLASAVGGSYAAEPERKRLASDAVVMPQDDSTESGFSPGEPAATGSLQAAIAALTVAEEVPEGYESEENPFQYPIDEDGDGCNTRREVLLAEATIDPVVGSDCELTGGTWYSYYDNAFYTSLDDLQIDHLVPRAEAWRSGGYAWTPDQRRAYGNDLADSRTLVAVATSLNLEKGDQPPGEDVNEWLPPYEGARCRYIEEWVAIKTAWELSIDPHEKADLEQLASGCP